MTFVLLLGKVTPLVTPLFSVVHLVDDRSSARTRDGERGTKVDVWVVARQEGEGVYRVEGLVVLPNFGVVFSFEESGKGTVKRARRRLAMGSKGGTSV